MTDKMIEAKSKKSILLLTFISLIPVSVASIAIGKSSSEVKTSDSFSITCTVSDLSDDIIFYRETIEIGRCAASVIPGLPGLCAAGFTQDITTNITTYSVASANATRDQGTWTCQHPPETSNELDLTVYGFPANPIVDNQAYLPNSIDTANMDSTQFTLNVSECVNPAPTISWTFFQDCEGTSITHIQITSTSSEDPNVACSSPYSAYKNTVKVADMKEKVGDGDYCYKVQSVVDYPGTSFIRKTVQFSQNITFTSPTVTTEMSSTSTGQDQTTSSQYPSIDYFHNTQQTETTIMTTTDNGLTSASLHVSSEVTTPIKTKSDNLKDLGVSAIIAIAISGFIFLFLIIILIICCRQYYGKKSKRKTSETFQEIHDDVVPTFWPNFNGHRYGINGINGSTVHVARGYNQYQGESDRGYNVRSTRQSDNYNRRRSNQENITENRKHKPKQVQGKISHGFPQSIPDDIMNRYDINGIHTYASHENYQNTRTHYREQAVSSPDRYEYRRSYLPQDYHNHNRRSSPYMTYLQEHVPRDLEGLIIYQGNNRDTNKQSRLYY